VFFKHVHFWEDSGMWELFSVIGHEVLHVSNCWESHRTEYIDLITLLKTYPTQLF
jgi:hypothetical protein